MNILSRLVAIASGVVSAWTLLKTIAKTREETRLSRLVPIVAVTATFLTTALYIRLSRATVNGWLVLPVLGLGLLLGLGEGQLTRVSHRGAMLVAKRSGLYLILWGLTYLATLALGQLGDAGMHATGVLTMMLGLGMAAGSNYVLLRKLDSMMHAPRV